MIPAPKTALFLALVLLLAACTDRNDETAPALDDPDTGTDAEQQILEMGSEDFQASEPAEPQRIEVAPTSRRGIVPSEAPLDLSELLTPRDLADLFPDGQISTQPFPGQRPSASYNARRFSLDDDPTLFGVGLQAWNFDDPDSQRHRLDALRDQFLNVSDPPDNAPDDAFLSRRAGLLTLVFPHPDQPRLFALTCDTSLCTGNSLVSLADTVLAP